MATFLGQSWHQYSLADIKIATQDFDDRLIIGHGGFGKVYKGLFKNEKGSFTFVAIKRLDSMSDQGETEFKAEIEMLSKLRHSHLVSLLGCCVDRKEMILVYEYMPRRTLYHHLHKSNIPLSWMQRLKISIGAARGLDYLHTGAGTKHGVIHRDVKSSNILLDKDWAAKISDFGLAKTCPINQSSTYVNTTIKGTFGYLDPLIFLTAKFTRKTDVFAFGVVLFELLSGRTAVLPDGDDDLSLATWAQKCVKKRNFDQLVAAEIRGKLSPKSLKEFARIAYRCLDSDPKERPTMSEVVAALQQSLTLQEKFDDFAKHAGLIRFTWKMPQNFVLSAKENFGHGDSKLSKNSKTNVNRSSVPTKGGVNRNEMLRDNEQILGQDLKMFSYSDLIYATRNFQGGMKLVGKRWVFKGWVDENLYSPSEPGVGLAIMVNKLSNRSEEDLQLLGEFSHPNLHRLLGYCLDNGELYLVHEFMENRSLKYYLQEAHFPFIMRVKVAVGVARGLVFLHRKKLIIKDWILDASEIWLDKDHNAKLIFFDVARLVNELAQYPIISQTFRRRQCDADGLGMLLMELLTGIPIPGKQKMNFIEQTHLSSANFVIEDLVDPRIILDAPLIERAQELLSLTLKCTRHNNYTMEETLEELECIYSKMTE